MSGDLSNASNIKSSDKTIAELRASLKIIKDKSVDGLSLVNVTLEHHTLPDPIEPKMNINEDKTFSNLDI